MDLTPIEASDVARLEPLWALLHAHHQSVAPELAPYVDADASWACRRAQYEAVLADGAVGFLAREDGVDVGYAMSVIRPMPWPAAFAARGSVAELMTLLVRPECRGREVGTALFDAVVAAMAAAGICDWLVGVIPGNAGAIGFYAKRGFVPAWITLTRFARSPAAMRDADVRSVEPAEIDRLRPLWLARHRRCRSVARALGPIASDGASWQAIRRLLLKAADEGLLLRIDEDGEPVAMACATILRDEPTLADTWLTGREVGEIKELAIADPARIGALGAALLDGVQRRLAAGGVSDALISAIHPDRDAVDVYQRHGFRPAWLEMIRFSRRR